MRRTDSLEGQSGWAVLGAGEGSAAERRAAPASSSLSCCLREFVPRTLTT